MFIGISKAASYEFTIASMFRDEAPYLKEWIEYHRMVGAEHFWLYDNFSEDNWREVVAPYIEEGLVEVIAWPARDTTIEKSGRPTSLGVRDRIQPQAMQDALRRAKGVAKWLAFIDMDEFFLPKKEKTVTECLNTHFSDASAVFVSWRNFGTNNMYIPSGAPTLCKLTACAVKEHSKNTNGKTIWRPEKVDIDSIWWVHTANPNSEGRYVNGSGGDVIYDPNKAGWSWKVEEDHMCLNHYFCRDENFFHNRRMALRGESSYSVEVLWAYHHDFSMEQNVSMKDFIQTQHPDMYEKFWKEKD